MSINIIQQKVYDLLDPGDEQGRLSSAVNLLIISMVLASIVLLALETDIEFAASHSTFFQFFESAAVIFFSSEYVLRFWCANAGQKYRSRWHYVVSTDSIIDLLALIPLVLSFLTESVELRYFLLLRLFQLLKLFRYFAPLNIMATVFKAEFRSFMSAMLVMLVLVFVSATGIYFFENNAQPEVFGSIPQSMWWSIVTLTTLGYGDIVPVTLGGKVFAGVMTVFAVGVVSLPAGMLASRFSEELNKRKQSFDMLMDEMMSDGQLDINEEVVLENVRQKLCLSESDVKALKFQRDNRFKQESLRHRHLCPNCGHRFERK